MDQRLTPKELAKELGHGPEGRPGVQVRRYLRESHPRPESEKGSPWTLTEEQADAVREHFRSKRA